LHEHANARQSIEAMIQSGDLEGLLREAEALHGHLCPFVSLGVKAGQYAMKQLNTGSTGMEEVVAIVECNNCFTDGIQVVTGCTFGNNALVFRDLGLVVRPEYRDEMFARYPAAGPLFEKVVVQRNATPEEEHHLHHIWPAMAIKELARPLEESLLVQEVNVRLPAYARIYPTVPCSQCGESVMEPRVRLVKGQPTCIPCAGAEYAELTGQGIGCGRF
jgi:formylmethanofuran dehydrogenase subunit E